MRETERQHDERGSDLVNHAIRGELSPEAQAELDRHMQDCVACAAELEAFRVFDAALEPGPADGALGRAAVDGALARLRPSRGSRSLPGWLLGPGLAAIGAGAAAVLFVLLRAPGSATGPVAQVVPASQLVLADGSEIAPDGPAQSVQLGEQTASRTIVRLTSGGARFRVRHDQRRLFQVNAGAFEIQDLGTVFHVAHVTGDRIRVSVIEGRVAVLCASRGLRVELGAGEDRIFSAAVESPPAPAPVEVTLAPAAASRGPAHAPSGAAAAPDDVSDLLAAADLARRSRRPLAAVPLLRRVVERFPRDPRAASAAFTLGWVLQTDLNRPREAALAFTQAERLAGRGPLAEDAAARVAEAWGDAGDSARATKAARHYERAYPTGQSLSSMRALIGAH